MFDDSTPRWLFVVGGVLFVGTTVAVTAVVTLYWSGRMDRVVPPIESEMADEASSYDFPDHRGRLRTESKDDAPPLALPTVQTDYVVDIQGDLATVSVTQTFENPTERTLHPVYEFPLHPDAALHEMRMEVGDRTIRADLKRKEEARETYERAKEAGNKAALLSQNRPNLFTQRVANLESGQSVEVTLRYVQALPRRDGRYRLALPLSVGERYVPDGASGAEKASPPSTLKRDSLSVAIHLHGGMPVSDIRSSSHPVHVVERTSSDWQIELPEGRRLDNRHFRLQYRLAGDETRTGLHAHWDEEREQGYFSFRLEPPRRVDVGEIPRREMVFVLDTSGSMEGEKFEQSKQFVVHALEQLRPEDTFRLLAFGDDVEVLSHTPLRATEAHLEKARDYLEELSPDGGTEMAPAIRWALASTVDEARTSFVTFVTDARVANELEIARMLSGSIRDARLFAVGIGGEVNQYLLQELAEQGRGFYRTVPPGEEGRRVFDRIADRITTPALSDIRIDWGAMTVDGVSPTPTPDLFEGEALRLHGRYHDPGTHTIRIRGETADGSVTFTRNLTLPGPETTSSGRGEAVRLTWARRQIEETMHRRLTPRRMRKGRISDSTLRHRIVDIALEHSLATQWTSFVAVEETSSESETPSTTRDRPSADSRRSPSSDESSKKNEPSSSSQQTISRETKTTPSPEEREEPVERFEGASNERDSADGDRPESKETKRIRRRVMSDGEDNSGDEETSREEASAGSGAGAGPSDPSLGMIRTGNSERDDTEPSLESQSFESDKNYDRSRADGIRRRDPGLSLAIRKEGSGRSRAVRESGGGVETQVVPRDPDVDGPIAKDAVRRVVHGYRSELEQCYASYLGEDSIFYGEVELVWTIESDGSTTGVSIRILDPRATAPKLMTCLESEMEGWTFPEPKRGTVDVVYPFKFDLE